MKSLLPLFLALFFVSACKSETPQATKASCMITYDNLDILTQKMRDAEENNKAFYAQMMSMNVDVLLARGCCKYEFTCPIVITD